MTTRQLAQVNVARIRHATFEDPAMADFLMAVPEMGALAAASPGFIWHLEQGPYSMVDPYGDGKTFFNLSVWESLKHLQDYVYRSVHTSYLRRKPEWFAEVPPPHLALWWVPAGHRPGVDEAMQRLDHLKANGPTPYAFTFAQRFLAEQAAERGGGQ